MNKVVNWIIDKGMFEDYEDRLVVAIKKSGQPMYFFDDQKRDSVMNEFLSKRFNVENDIVIFHGSLQHGRRVAKTSFYPGIYLTLENYECFRYYGVFGSHLLNSNYLMMGLNDVIRQKEMIFDIFKGDGIFIRPSNGYKSFPGQTLPKNNFEFEFNVMLNSYGGINTDKLAVVSPLQEIDKEYRFIVVDGEVISGSLYMDINNRKSWQAYYDKICKDQEAIDFAKEMAKIFQPDRAYTLDVCKLSNGEYKLIELNSFCCGSMYGNDYDKVVDAINKLCVDDYNDVYI